MKEFNTTPAEQGTQPPERTSALEILTAKESPNYGEIVSMPEANAPPTQTATPKRQKKAKSVSKLLTTFLTTTAVAVTAGVTVIAPVKDAISPLANVTVELREFGVDLDDVFYFFAVDSDVPLQVVLTSPNNAKRANTLSEQTPEGMFDNLVPGVRYTMTVEGDGLLGKEILFSQTIVIEE